MKDIQQFLDAQYVHYNQHFDIASDPLSIPKKYTTLQDIEISGFLAATIAWGNRKAIIKSATELMERMDHKPYDFIMHHSDNDLKQISSFYYRTFNGTDLLYFIEFFKWHYQQFPSLEDAFTLDNNNGANFDIKLSLSNFYQHFFAEIELPFRTQKHIGNVQKKSACKRINMFLRWMVRQDNIDFGLWKNIPTNQLICPLDIHVSTVARQLKLIDRKQDDWITAVELTDQLKSFDNNDPVKYDLVLFSLGVEGKMK